jgi:hypothetical protein
MRVFQNHVGVDDPALALRMWKIIKHRTTQIKWETDARNKITNIQKAKRDLDEIASAARRLERLLLSEPLLNLLVSGPLLSVPTDEEIEHYVDAPAILLQKLRKIESNADLFAKDDDLFRGTHGLPDRVQSQSPVVCYLWPTLFAFWERAEKRLSHTKNGPLHRFVSFVHAELGYDSPSPSTLRDAIARYVGRASKNGKSPTYD